MQITFKIFLLLLFFQTVVISQSTLEKVKSLELEFIESTTKTFYSEGYKSKAEEIESTLSNSTFFFENEFGVSQDFEIAVLNSEDWQKISQIPFGLPFVSGPPYIVCIPANTNNELGTLVKRALSQSDLDEKYNLSNEEIAHRFITLIGFHELGHIYSKAIGINFPNKWTFEFAATYFAYLYLKDNAPDKNQLWLDVADILLNDISPKHTSLKDFEELYVRVGVENYAWYQVVFLKRVAQVAAHLNKAFINELKSKKLSNDNLSLDELENIDEGFLEWATSYRLLEE